MFSLCESMKWAHLPVAGGLYNQHPDLLSGFRYIFAVRNEYEAQERARQEAEQKRPRNPGARPRGRRK